MKLGFNLFPKILGYKLFRQFGTPKMMPMSVTISVTNMCNSQCKTCYIWKTYQDNLDLKENELKVFEFDRIFESLGENITNVVISGGEPYLRSDLVEICKVIHERSHPEIVVIPTNGLLPSMIEEKTKNILEIYTNASIIVNLSLDGIENKHDEIRGVAGNFEKSIETYSRLRKLREEYSNLKLGIHSVVSKFNIDELPLLYDYVKKLNPESYICEYAEHRYEMFNLDKDIAPDLDKYSTFVKELCTRIQKDYIGKRLSTERIIQSLRLIYYDLAVREIREKRQIISCYAGFASCQISPYGDVWPCAVLGNSMSMGDLREVEYDFKKIWYSKRGDNVRRYIKAGKCTCPLQNTHTTNILFDFRCVVKVLLNVLK